MHNKLPTIGVAGVTIPGALDCIQKMHQQFTTYFTAPEHPSIILLQPNFAPMREFLITEKWEQIEDGLVDTIKRLQNTGADFAIIPANTVHKVIAGVQKRSAIPVLNMLEIVAEEAKGRGLKKVGVLGTQWTMANHLYREFFIAKKIEELIPSSQEQEVIQQAILKELVPTGAASAHTVNALLNIVKRLQTAGCDGIALACTELPLVLNSGNCGMLVLDTTAILAEVAVKRAKDN